METIFAYIHQIPDWLGAAICGVIGWVGHIFYEALQDRKAPFEQDVKRFNDVIEAIDPYSIEYFRHIDIGDFSAMYSDGLMSASGNIDLINKFEKTCLDKELKEKEEALVRGLNEITKFVAYKSYYKTGSTSSRTCLWDTFSEELPEDREEAEILKKEAHDLGLGLFQAYHAYKSYGDKKFAKKISE